MVVVFGKLFSDMIIERKDLNDIKAQSIKVPIAYGPKEKWLRHLQENPDLTKQVKMELPRMSFEMASYQYDPERKLGPNTNYLRDLHNRKVSTPIPYNFNMILYIASRTQEDMLNITEQILPFFSPALTVNVKLLNDPQVIIDIPIILTTSTQEDNWDNDMLESRLIVNTLSFTMKGYMFGPIDDSQMIIKRSIANVSQRADMTINPQITDSKYYVELNPFVETDEETDPHVKDEFWINF